MSDRTTKRMRAAHAAGAILLAMLSLSVAYAAEGEKTFAAPQAVERVATPGAGSLVQVTVSLVLVLGAVFAAAWVMRRLRTFGRFGSGPIEIVADVAIGARERAVLVQVGGKQLLLGVAPGRVSTLHVLDEPVRIERPGASTSLGSAEAAQKVDFKSILKRSLGL
ncbi:MAG TPA: flagellar biosynthetic protein FliO [Steroidobacteraceae bacterium]